MDYNTNYSIIIIIMIKQRLSVCGPWITCNLMGGATRFTIVRRHVDMCEICMRVAILFTGAIVTVLLIWELKREQSVCSSRVLESDSRFLGTKTPYSFLRQIRAGEERGPAAEERRPGCQIIKVRILKISLWQSIRECHDSQPK